MTSIIGLAVCSIGLAVYFNAKSSSSTDRENKPSKTASTPHAVPPPTVGDSQKDPLIDEKLLANGRWSLSQIQQNPSAIVEEIRNEFSGKELLNELLGLGSYVQMYGCMDDLHSLMCVIDNPAATADMAWDLAGMAHDKEDAMRLLQYSAAWTGQAEESQVKTALLRKAGALLGIDALGILAQQEGAEPTAHEKSEILSGATAADASGVRKWLLDTSLNNLSKNDVTGVLNRLSAHIPISTAFSDALALSQGDAARLDSYVESIVVGSGLKNMSDPKSTLNDVIHSEILNESQKLRSTQMLVTFWSSGDLTGAAAWAADLPVGPLRDRAFLGVLNQVQNARLQIPEAVDWANLISDKKLRAFALKNIKTSE